MTPETEVKKENKSRLYLIDSLRGFSVISMILFHTVWDLVRIFGVNLEWFNGPSAAAWQSSICFVFITLCGFCISIGKHRLKNGIKLLLSGSLVTLVTLLVMPKNRIIFGVLTLLGSCILVSIPTEKLLRKINPYIGAVSSLALFLLFKDLVKGIFFFSLKVPKQFYSNILTAYIGFPPAGFFSADYYPLLPWIFVFFLGYFIYRIFEGRGLLTKLKKPRIPPLEWLGRHALVIYLLHQPLIYFILSVIFKDI